MTSRLNRGSKLVIMMTSGRSCAMPVSCSYGWNLAVVVVNPLLSLGSYAFPASSCNWYVGRTVLKRVNNGRTIGFPLIRCWPISNKLGVENRSMLFRLGNRIGCNRLTSCVGRTPSEDGWVVVVWFVAWVTTDCTRG